MKNVLYFTAAWCGPCRMFKPVLQEVTSELGIPTQIIDVDTNPDLTQQYTITGVPTLIVFKDGTQVYRSTGAMSKPQLENLLS
jgi:thioredoxin 1